MIKKFAERCCPRCPGGPPTRGSPVRRAWTLSGRRRRRCFQVRTIHSRPGATGWPSETRPLRPEPWPARHDWKPAWPAETARLGSGPDDGRGAAGEGALPGMSSCRCQSNAVLTTFKFVLKIQRWWALSPSPAFPVWSSFRRANPGRPVVKSATKNTEHSTGVTGEQEGEGPPPPASAAFGYDIRHPHNGLSNDDAAR